MLKVLGMYSQPHSTAQAETGFVIPWGLKVASGKRSIIRRKSVTIQEFHFARDRPSLALSLELEC